MHTSIDIDRITVSLPHSLAGRADELRAELKISRSELYRIALERFIDEQKRKRVAAIAAEMAEEYRINIEFTEMTALDHEDFA